MSTTANAPTSFGAARSEHTSAAPPSERLVSLDVFRGLTIAGLLTRRTTVKQQVIIYGMNPMVAFVGSGIMAWLIYSLLAVSVGGKRIVLETAVYQIAFPGWLEPVNASLAFAITFVLFWFLVLYVLHRKRIFFKI